MKRSSSAKNKKRSKPEPTDIEHQYRAALRSLSNQDFEDALACIEKYSLFSDGDFHRHVTRVVLDENVDPDTLKELIKKGLRLDQDQVRYHLHKSMHPNACIHCKLDDDTMKTLAKALDDMYDLAPWESRNLNVASVLYDPSFGLRTRLRYRCLDRLQWADFETMKSDLAVIVPKDMTCAEYFKDASVWVGGKKVAVEMIEKLSASEDHQDHHRAALLSLSNGDAEDALERINKHNLFSNGDFHRYVTQIVLNEYVSHDALHDLLEAGLCLDDPQVRYHVNKSFSQNLCIHCRHDDDYLVKLSDALNVTNDLAPHESCNMLAGIMCCDPEGARNELYAVLREKCGNKAHWADAETMASDLKTLVDDSGCLDIYFRDLEIWVGGKDVTAELGKLAGKKVAAKFAKENK